MKTLAKRFLRFLWHYSKAYQLITLPLSGFSVAISSFTFLAVAFGFRLPWWGYLIFFFGVVTFVGFLGIMAVKMGFVAYFQSLENSQNELLTKIGERLEKIEKKLPHA